MRRTVASLGFLALAAGSAGCGTERFSKTDRSVDVTRSPVGRTGAVALSATHLRTDVVMVDVVRRFTCEDDTTHTTTERTTQGRRIGGGGRATEWMVLGVGVAAMVGGAVLLATDAEDTSRNTACCDVKQGQIVALTGFILASYAGFFLGVDHALTYESTSRSPATVRRDRTATPCGTEAGAGAEVVLHLPAGLVRAQADGSGRATFAVPRAALGPRVGLVRVPLTVEGRLVGEVELSLEP